MAKITQYYHKKCVFYLHNITHWSVSYLFIVLPDPLLIRSRNLLDSTFSAISREARRARLQYKLSCCEEEEKFHDEQ